MTHLPADVTDAARRLSKPLDPRRLIQQPEGVVASKDDLLDGQLESIHGFTPLQLLTPFSLAWGRCRSRWWPAVPFRWLAPNIRESWPRHDQPLVPNASAGGSNARHGANLRSRCRPAG